MKHILLILTIVLLSNQIKAQKEQIAISGKNGIFVHLGINIPNGTKTDFYIIERKTENGDWKSIAKVKFPENINQFEHDYKIYKKLFPYINNNIDTKSLFEKISLAESIRDSSIAKEMNLLSLRLAVGNIFYDQEIDKYVLYQYRVTSFANGDSQYQIISEIENYPNVIAFSPLKTLLMSRTDSTEYIKWYSEKGSNPYWVALYHYENNDVVLDDNYITHYNVGDTIYYFTELQKSLYKQFFLIPFDYYGNQGKPSQIAYVEKIEPTVNYFSNINADKNNEMLKIDLSWKLNNKDDIKQINILRSEEFDGEFKKISTVSNTTQFFTDDNIKPDKIYYYQLDALLTFSNQHIKTVRFHGFGFENQPPIPPQIKVLDNEEKRVVLQITGSNEKFIRGVRVYRKKINAETKPILVSDLLILMADTTNFIDTSNIEGGYNYEYFAKSENTSHLESDFSNPVKVMSLNKVKFLPMSGFTNIVYDKNEVHLYWDNISDKSSLIIGYRIYRKKDLEKWGSLLPKDSLFILNRFVDKNLIDGNYKYKICPIDFLFREGFGSITLANISSTNQLIGSDLILSSTNKGIQIRLSKIAIRDIKKYKIYRYQRNEIPKVIAELPVSNEEYLDKKVKRGKLYFYFTTLINNEGKESLKGKEAGLRY